MATARAGHDAGLRRDPGPCDGAGFALSLPCDGEPVPTVRSQALGCAVRALAALVVLGALVLRLARVEHPRLVPLGAQPCPWVTVGTVRLGQTVLGWTVLCHGHEVLGHHGDHPPTAVLSGSGIVAVVGAPMGHTVSLVRTRDCATAEIHTAVAGTTAWSLDAGRLRGGDDRQGPSVDLRTVPWVNRSGR